MNKHKMIVNGIRDLIDDVRTSLADQDVINASELLEHGEWGEALYLVCTQLYEYEVTISRSTYDQIAELGSQMNMPAKQWMMLNELVK